MKAAARTAAMLLAAAAAGCGDAPGGTAAAEQRVQHLLRTHGCVHCHAIDGVAGADGRVGPSLHGLRLRRVIAGGQPNDVAHLTRFLLDPRAMSPGSAMPRTVDDPADARAIAHFLHDLPPPPGWPPRSP